MALVLIACLAPPFALLCHVLWGAGSGTGAGFLLEERHGQLFLRSLLVAVTATLLALAWGFPTGLAISRLRHPLGAILEWASYLPLLLPPMVTVLGWIYFLGRAGLANRFLQTVLNLSGPPINLYTPLGAGFVLSLIYFPCVSVLCAQGFRSVPEESIRAATLVASPALRLGSIWRPLLAPHVATACLLVFLLSFTDFSVPSALTVNVYPVEIHAQLCSGPAEGPARAALLALPPLLLAVALCIARHALVRSSPFPSPGMKSRIASRCPRAALVVSLAAIFCATVVPLVFLAITAGSPEAYVRALRTAGDQVLTSLQVASWATPLLLLLAVAFAAAFRASGATLRVWAEALVLLPLVIPGAAVGLGILYLESHGVPPWSWVYPHPAVVAYAAACRFLPFPALILAGASISVERSILRAGSICGAGPWRISFRLVLPLILPAFLAAAVLSFVLSLGELSAAVLVTPPGVMTLPVRLASLLHFGEEAVVAALCLMVSGFVVGLLCLFFLLTNRPLRVKLNPAEGFAAPGDAR